VSGNATLEARLKHLFLSTRHGRIHALESGQGTPLILLHTLGGSVYQFEHMLPLVGQRYRAIALDMIGHGDSDPLNRHLSLEDHSDALADAMKALGLAKATVFGQSVGGYLTALIGGRWADLCAHIVIGEAPPRTSADYAANWLEIEQGCSDLTSTFEALKPRFRSLTPELLVRWNIDRRKAGTRALMATYWAIREFDFFRALKDIRVPALLLLGENGIASSELAQRYYELASELNMPVQVLRDVGHFISIDDPVQLLRHIDALVPTHA